MFFNFKKMLSIHKLKGNCGEKMPVHWSAVCEATVYPLHLDRIATSQDSQNLRSVNINGFHVLHFLLFLQYLLCSLRYLYHQKHSSQENLSNAQYWCVFFQTELKAFLEHLFVGTQCVTVPRFLTFNWKVKTLEHLFLSLEIFLCRYLTFMVPVLVKISAIS